MKIIFLDIDGVLNSIQSSFRHGEHSYDYEGLDAAGIGLLRMVCEATDAKIVISSTWRSDGHQGIAGAFASKGWRDIIFRKTVIDTTPWPGYSCRGEDIKHWMEDYPTETTNYVILDDDSDMLDEQLDNFICVDSMTGLTIYDAVRAIDILGGANSNNEKATKEANHLKEMVEHKMARRKDKDCRYTL